MTTRSGGLRLRLLIGASAAVLVVAACGGSPTATTAPASAPPAAATDEPPSGESPSAPTGEIDLFNTDYAPADGADGGTAIVGDWQEATQFNPYYLTQVTEANVASADVGDPRDVHPRLQVRAGPRGRDPDPRERRRQGAGRQRRRDDRHLEAA